MKGFEGERKLQLLHLAHKSARTENNRNWERERGNQKDTATVGNIWKPIDIDWEAVAAG